MVKTGVGRRGEGVKICIVNYFRQREKCSEVGCTKCVKCVWAINFALKYGTKTTGVVKKCNQTSRTWILSEDIHFVEERNETCYQDQGVIGAGFGRRLDVVMGLRNFMMLLRDLLLMERSGERIDHKLKYPLRLMPIKLPVSVEKMANHSFFSLFWNERVKLITHEKDNSRICSFANDGSHLLTSFWASGACSNLREFSLSRLLFRFARHSICNKVLVRESSRVNETRAAKARFPRQASRGKVLAHSSSVFLSQF